MIAAPPERGGGKERRRRRGIEREREGKKKKVVREITDTPTINHTKFNILACTLSKFQE
jgi:hypothetical protein